MPQQYRRVTIRDIAKRAGVSHSTVSLVMHGAGRISPATRARVELAMRELGYRYNRAAANLRRNAAQAIGLVINDISNPFFAEVTAGVQDVAADNGYMVFLVDSQEDTARQERLLESLVEHVLAGIIISPVTGSTPESLDRIAGWRVPCAIAVRRLIDERFDFVGPDDQEAARQAVDYLYGLGHRRIGFIGALAANPSRRDRMAGYTAQLDARGIPFDPTLVTESRVRSGAAAADVAAILAARPQPTALLCHNEYMALSIMQALRELGVEPGRDMAVMSFDDTQQASVAYPPLTTMALFPREIGRRVASVMLARLAEPDGPRETILVPPRLMIRASCGVRSEVAAGLQAGQTLGT